MNPKEWQEDVVPREKCCSIDPRHDVAQYIHVTSVVEPSSTLSDLAGGAGACG
jgi:hypothetical protein